MGCCGSNSEAKASSDDTLIEHRAQKLLCPANHHEGKPVSVQTILHQILQPWVWQPTATQYFYCEDHACDVAYFGDDGSRVLRSQLRASLNAPVGSPLLCYCFAVTEDDYQRDATIKDFVIAQTKAGMCSCKTSNPSGRCCLKSFPQPSPI